MRRVASSPSITGIEMSIIIRWYVLSDSFSTASAPLLAESEPKSSFSSCFCSSQRMDLSSSTTSIGFAFILTREVHSQLWLKVISKWGQNLIIVFKSQFISLRDDEKPDDHASRM